MSSKSTTSRIQLTRTRTCQSGAFFAMRGSLLVIAMMFVCLGGVRPAASAGDATSSASASSAASSSAEAWEELAPMLLQIINLSALDPDLAAGLVPETWVAAAVEGALLVESESPSASAEPVTAQSWPIGPWSSSNSLAASIRAVQPGAVVGLFRALQPRLNGECRRRDVDSVDCERAIKVTASRLSASSVVEQAARPSSNPEASLGARRAAPLTATQFAVAQLGEPAAEALRVRIRAVGTTLWGPPSRQINPTDTSRNGNSTP